MPNIEDHNKQYLSNMNFLNTLTLDLKNIKHPDWAYTVIFYTAIHIIEKDLAVDNKHPKDHKNRTEILKTSTRYDYIFSKYKTLENQSRRARYNCYKPTKTDIKDALKYLNDIKQELTA